VKEYTILLRKYAFVFLFLLTFISIAETASAQSSVCEARLSKATIKKTDGFLPVYRFENNDGFIIGIPKNDPNQQFILSTYLEQGVSNFIGDYVQSSIIRFEQSGNKVRIIETFANLTYSEGSPLAKTRDTSLSDSRIVEFSLLTCSDDNFIYAVANERTLKMFADPAILQIRRSVGGVSSSGMEAKTKSVESYTDNINFTVDLNFSTSRQAQGAANRRNFSARVSHSITKLPDNDFLTRDADPSIGYFTVNRLDISQISQLGGEEFINRWRLVKKDPNEPLSEPVKPILFWIENTTPYAFRDPIRNGVLAWNEAFEAAGFSNAIQVKMQPDDAKWDAGISIIT